VEAGGLRAGMQAGLQAGLETRLEMQAVTSRAIWCRDTRTRMLKEPGCFQYIIKERSEGKCAYASVCISIALQG
jgi:hypothetical protein